MIGIFRDVAMINSPIVVGVGSLKVVGIRHIGGGAVAVFVVVGIDIAIVIVVRPVAGVVGIITIVVAAGAPTEEVYPTGVRVDSAGGVNNALVIATFNIALIRTRTADIVPLVVGNPPGMGAAIILQVAGSEVDLIIGSSTFNSELAVLNCAIGDHFDLHGEVDTGHDVAGDAAARGALLGAVGGDGGAAIVGYDGDFVAVGCVLVVAGVRHGRDVDVYLLRLVGSKGKHGCAGGVGGISKLLQ